MVIKEDTELDGKILCYASSLDKYYKCYTFKLNDIEKVIRYYGDIHTYWNCMVQYASCQGSNIRICDYNNNQLYTEALIKLKNGLCLISFISFELSEDDYFKRSKIDFLPYFKEHNLYEERPVTQLYEDLQNFISTTDKIYKANPSLYSYICPNYKCSRESKSEENNETTLKIKISQKNIEKFDYVIINGIKFKRD